MNKKNEILTILFSTLIYIFSWFLISPVAFKITWNYLFTIEKNGSSGASALPWFTHIIWPLIAIVPIIALATFLILVNRKLNTKIKYALFWIIGFSVIWGYMVGWWGISFFIKWDLI